MRSHRHAEPPPCLYRRSFSFLHLWRHRLLRLTIRLAQYPSDIAEFLGLKTTVKGFQDGVDFRLHPLLDGAFYVLLEELYALAMPTVHTVAFLPRLPRLPGPPDVPPTQVFRA